MLSIVTSKAMRFLPTLSASDTFYIFRYKATDIPGNGLITEGPPDGLESVYDYEPGGHHPVHLDDVLHNRYKVIHKLGSGGYANVWLCRDTSISETRYVAIKILLASGSTSECPELRINKLIDMGVAAEAAAEHFCLPLDQFSITGPNGEHYALVYPVLGPRVSILHEIVYDDDLDLTLQKIARQVIQAISTLHANGICHGDFRPANILARISSLDGLSEEDVFTLVGRPEKTGVVIWSREKHNLPTAPQYLVYPIIWEDIAENPSVKSLITGEVCITDFGESFEISNPPPALGIPQIYLPPEYVLDKTIGASCDVWALACTLFEIRTGRRLFDTFSYDQNVYLYSLVWILGKLPEPWWSTTWEARSCFLDDEVDADGKVVRIGSSHQYETESDEEIANSRHDSRPVYRKPEPRSIRELVYGDLVYGSRRKHGNIWRERKEAEVDCFADLLERLLKYIPEERLGLADVLEHPWFKMQAVGQTIKSMPIEPEMK
ncbi:kinase-like domain-containing protein [Xylaria arbuscula]|nr:kinase-like domain-containing protein [Xylaria arbuscula]